MIKDKTRGMLVGLAVGDALGANLEFAKSSHEDITAKDASEMSDGMYPKGAWTDDTSMALCLADSLLECGGYDSYDVMQKYSDWLNKGYRTYDGKPAGDVGNQVRSAILGFDNGNSRTMWKEYERSFSAGNGAIMRLAPAVIATTFPHKKVPTLKESVEKNLPWHVIYHTAKTANSEFITRKDIAETQELARISARETHYSLVAEAATEIFATMLYCALRVSKSNVASLTLRLLPSRECAQVWFKNLDSFTRAFDKTGKSLRDLGGYIIDAITIATWGLLKFDTFEKGMIAVIRLGGDTDTNAAIYGQLAGAYYGYKAIPKRWLKDLYLHDEIVELADKLLAMKKCPIIQTRFEEDEEYYDDNEK